MSYTRVNWQDSPSTTTPISAANLNTMDAGIKDLDTALTTTSESLTQSITTLSNRAKVTELCHPSYPITASDTISYNLSDSLENYDLISFQRMLFANVYETHTIPVAQFKNMVIGARALYLSSSAADYAFGWDGNTAIKAKFDPHSSSWTSYGTFTVVGIKL